MTRRKPGAARGRPPRSIEHHLRRFEFACIKAFLDLGIGPFDATNRALMIVRGGPISMSDVMGVLRLSQMSIPLPEARDEPDAARRRLFATAKRQLQRSEPWLVESSALIQGVILFMRAGNVPDACLCLDNLLLRGWRPVIAGVVERIEMMLKSNIPPADLASLGPQARQLVERLTGDKFPKRRHRKK